MAIRGGEGGGIEQWGGEGRSGRGRHCADGSGSGGEGGGERRVVTS